MRNAVRALVVGVAALFASFAWGQDVYPSKPIRIMAGGAAGGLLDMLARLVATEMQKGWGQPVIVENKPGAAGVIAAVSVAKAAADGYTLLLAPGAHAIVPALRKIPPYDAVRDFTAITLLVSMPNILVVRANFTGKDVKDYVALAKSGPGQVTYATSGIGTTVHLGGEMFSSLAGIKLNHIPFKGANESVAAVVAGQVDSSWSAVSAALPSIKSGRARALAVASERRTHFLPDVPTFAEQGITGLKSETWYGVLGPANLPAPIVQKLNNFLVQWMERPDMRESIMKLGMETVVLQPVQFADQIRRELDMYSALARSANIKQE